jgi:CheY-like chemotaxis protein
MATQVLIADDDPTIRLLLRRLLEKQGVPWLGRSQNPLGLFSKKRFAHPQVVTAALSLSPKITNSVCGSFA